MDPHPDTKYISVKEAAHRMGVSSATITRYIRQGSNLPYLRVGRGTIRIPLQRFLIWLKEYENNV